MPDWISGITLDTVWYVLKWLGGGAVLAGLAWLLKLPQKAWRRFERWVILKHDGIPRRPLLVTSRRSEWHFGARAKEPATQVHVSLTVTNISTKFRVEIIEAWFRQAWRWRKHRLGMVSMVVEQRALEASLRPSTVASVDVDGFILPRIEWNEKAIKGTLWLVDQFHNRYPLKIRLEPGGDVPSGVEIEKEKRDKAKAEAKASA